MPTVNCNIHNRFDIEVIDAKSGEIKQRAQAENIICNQLWTRMLEPNTYNNYIHYGTGSGTPSVTDTKLFTFFGFGMPETANDVYTYNWADGYVSLRRKIQLSESTANGATITEVGIGYGTTATTLVTHAMLKDMNGNAISIAKTSTDIVNIYATVFFHWDTNGYDGGKVRILHNSGGIIWGYFLGRTDPTYAIHGAMCTLNATMWGDLNGQTYPAYYYRADATKAFSAASKTITLTLGRLSTTSGNIGGFKSVALCSRNYDKVALYPWLQMYVGGTVFPGTNVTGAAIGTGDGATKDFSFAFSDVQPGAKIYINGVEQTAGYTINADAPLLTTEMGAYFQLIESNFANTPVMAGASAGYGTLSGQCTSIYYNPYYTFGISSFFKFYLNVFVSNDLENWVQLGANTNSETVTVSAPYQNYKYWKLVRRDTTAAGLFGTVTTNGVTGKHLHFATPPAAGAVITADYATKTIAKDANHVFDCTITIQLGELIV